MPAEFAVVAAFPEHAYGGPDGGLEGVHLVQVPLMLEEAVRLSA